MPRPSPRTEDGGYGTQQLDFVAGKPPQVGTPYQGVVVKPPSFVGFQGFTQGILPRGIFGTPSAQPHSNPNVVSGGTYISPPIEATGAGTTGNGNGNEKEKCHLDDDKPFCGFTELMGGEVCQCPNWFTGKTTDPTKGGRGCECEACKNGTGQCSDKVPECNAWDLGCEITDNKAEETVLWIKIILVIIGIGVFLWLLRPLFSRGGQRPSGIALTPI